MNYLAHAYLSFDHPELLIGNMISDFVKGKEKYNYSAEVQSGIMLHRMIDEFTDNHSVNKEAKKVFSAAYRLYSGAFLDVVYDHFLAIDKDQFADKEALQIFSQRVYSLLQIALKQTPAKFQNMFPYMKKHNWLYNYRYLEGIQQSLEGVRYRAKYIAETETAFSIFKDNYQELHDSYDTFFPDLKNFVKHLI